MSLPPAPGAPPVPAVCLVVLDGWGLAPPGPGNAIALASTPVFDELWSRHARTTLATSGAAVGLPEGQMGNSEVGHLNLGAGSVVRQDLTRIDAAIASGDFAADPALRDASEAGREAGRLHLIGLVSDGGVHSSPHHLHAAVQLAAVAGVPDVVVHAFTDGRDTPPDSAAAQLADFDRRLRELGGRIGSVTGRYYGMDRDGRWERTKAAYDAIVHGRAGAPRAESGEGAVTAAYERGETDEFILPTLVGEEACVRDGDAVVMMNFRPDRARQLTRALGEADFGGFDRSEHGAAPAVALTTLTEYQEDWSYPVAFGPEPPAVTLASVLARRGIRQLHVAETEKYAHVTYFFNGGEEQPHEGEERRLVDSPRDVPTYDHRPEMSARAAAEAFAEGWSSGGFGFGVINFANPDMVGHTGVVEAAVRAVEVVDKCLGKVVAAVHEAGGACIVTADHGNADRMLDEDGNPDTAHTKNPVPLVITADAGDLREGGVLADVAPTVLSLLGQHQPAEMTGRSLLERV